MTMKQITTEPREQLVVRKKTAEAPEVFTLQLSRADGTIPHYISGQFINVYFPELGEPQGKGYSISSAPGEETLNLTVKRIGGFSKRLCAMEPGDTVEASLPCGYFFSESEESTLVMLAAGIGISPFRSISLDALQKNPKRKLMLFYSNQTEQDMVFKKTIDEACAGGTMSAFYFATRQEAQGPIIQGRMSAESVLSRVGDAPNPEFLICGSISFVRDMWRDLRSKGIPEEALYTEAFFSH